MRKAKVFNFDVFAGVLAEEEEGFSFVYEETYQGPPISLTMPVEKKNYFFDVFPPFFEGLLPEGVMLEALLKNAKLDQYDFFGQLVTVGHDLIGSVTVEEY